MRSLRLTPRTTPALALYGLAIAMGAGCKSPSQLVLGFATDLSAPNAIDTVQMRVLDPSSQLLLSNEWVLPGTRERDFRLPGSFTLFADGGGEPTLRVELVGLKGGAQVVSRTNTLGLLAEDTLFFRMTLVERCTGMVCSSGESCVEGKCKADNVNLISLLPYHGGEEALVQCASGSTLTDTGTHEAMALEGSGYCAADQWCGDAICYRNQGQGLLWCTPPGFSCKGIDGYEGCLVSHCQPELAACYGADWRRGHFGGPCADYARCKTACACDAACVSACDADRASSCSACLDGSGGVTGCLTTADAACNDPACTPIAGGPPVDGGAGDGGNPLAGLTLIPQGTYTIGCDAADMGCLADEVPSHHVGIGAIYMDPLEITQAKYEECVQAAACTAPTVASYTPTSTPTIPVTQVSWADAQKYCTWRGTVLGVQARLPSEAEWEIAAHGVNGQATQGLRYPWGDTDPIDCTLALFSACDPLGPVAVGTHPGGASAFGVQDLAGNVAEWVNDWYDAGWYSQEYMQELTSGPVMNPMGPGPASALKVIRGGGWSSTVDLLRATARHGGDPATTFDFVGIRCVYLPM